MRKIATTVLSGKVQIIAGVKPNCWLISEQSENSTCAGITDSVTETPLIKAQASNSRKKTELLTRQWTWTQVI